MPELEPVTFDYKKEYKRLVENMPVMLWTADATGQWTHVNRSWVEYTGLIGESTGFGFEAALHPDDVAPTLEVWRNAVATEVAYNIEYRLRDTGGNYRWFVVRGRHLIHDIDPSVSWVGTCSDINDQKVAEDEAKLARIAAIRALGLALEVRDRETSGHTDRVTRLAEELGLALGLSASTLEDLKVGSLLHDIGKISISDAVLLKPGPLDAAERIQINTHAVAGEQFAAALGFIPPAALQLVRHHHERWDGAGYPDHLRGEAIPVLARLFAVVDTYDALVSERPYKSAWSRQEAEAELSQQAGQQFDPVMVQAFLRLEAENLLSA
ncbi:HD domain-containing phosphohydrolase [Deinococcus altitudinis]|uniref:HD domain-containing phosphohydrolase n=1 Tax=Deinococcus altitudinis TaxID=468914 RepID=UPI0038923163